MVQDDAFGADKYISGDPNQRDDYTRAMPVITHTTMGHPVLSNDEPWVDPMPPATTKLGIFVKKWIPNVGVKGRHRKKEGLPVWYKLDRK